MAAKEHNAAEPQPQRSRMMKQGKDRRWQRNVCQRNKTADSSPQFNQEDKKGGKKMGAEKCPVLIFLPLSFCLFRSKAASRARQ
jgi:hypothetical protein